MAAARSGSRSAAANRSVSSASLLMPAIDCVSTAMPLLLSMVLPVADINETR